MVGITPWRQCQPDIAFHLPYNIACVEYKFMRASADDAAGCSRALTTVAPRSVAVHTLERSADQECPIDKYCPSTMNTGNLSYIEKTIDSNL